MPKVSIIIPVYNVEKYLGQCLDSVVGQTLSDIEVICVNDGSSDNSLDILNEYAARDSRIKVISQDNHGAGIARNAGIHAANGEFVCFIDPDDVYPFNDILENLYNCAKDNGVLIAGGEFSTFTDDVTQLSQNFKLKKDDGYLFDKDGILNYSDYQFDYGFHRFIYNRKFLLENNIFYPSYRRFEDPFFMVRAFIAAEKFYALDKITYAYRFKHKEQFWNQALLEDRLKGTLDVIVLADKYKFDRLKYYCYRRLKELKKPLKQCLNDKLLSILKEICKYEIKIRIFCLVNNLTSLRIIINRLFEVKNA